MNYKKLLPGMRIIKTVFAIATVLFAAYFFNYYDPFYAVIAVVLVIRRSQEKTLAYAYDRMLGTFLGGLMGFALLKMAARQELSVHSLDYFIAIVFVSFLTLWLSKLLSLRESASSIALILVFSTLLLHNEALWEAKQYMMVRSLETFFGICVGVFYDLVFDNLFKKRTQKQ